MIGSSERERALQVIRTVLAADYCCDARDFERDDLVVVPAGDCPGRRRFPIPTKALQIVTLGAGTVVA